MPARANLQSARARTRCAGWAIKETICLAGCGTCAAHGSGGVQHLYVCVCVLFLRRKKHDGIHTNRNRAASQQKMFIQLVNHIGDHSRCLY